MRSSLWIILLGGILTSLTACSLQAKVLVTASGPTEVSASFALKPPAMEAWKALRDLDPSLPANPLDPTVLRQGFGPQTKVATQGGTTSLGFVLSEPRRLFTEMKTGQGTFELTIDRATVRRLAGQTSWAESPALDSFLPAPGVKISEAEYTDLLAYLLGPNVTDVAAKGLIAGSAVELTVEAPATIRSAEGAVRIEGKTAVYRWPLVKVLTLEAPIRLVIRY